MDPIDKLNEEGKEWAEALQRAEELYADPVMARALFRVASRRRDLTVGRMMEFESRAQARKDEEEQALAKIDLGAALDAYQAEAKKTTIYPGAGWDVPFPFAQRPEDLIQARKNAIAYLALGFAGEFGEYKASRPEESRSEFGDVLWYAAEIARWLGKPLSALANFQRLKHGRGNRSARLDGEWLAVARLCELAKKTSRDGETAERNEKIAECVTHALYEEIDYVPLSCWPGIMDANLQKLKGRAERGTLKGDGEGR